MDWGETEGELPAKIYGYVDLRRLSPGFWVEHGQCRVVSGVYAIIESATFAEEEEIVKSDFFIRIHKEVGGFTHDQVSHFKYHLADVEAFVRPVVVIPVMGGPPNDYFLLRDRAKWKEDFESWLEDDHELDEIEDDIANMPTGADGVGLIEERSSVS